MASNGSDVATKVVGSSDSDSHTLLADERQQLADEFNKQRAKMKELFLQKEDEMRRMKEEKQQLESEIVGLRSQLQQLKIFSDNQKHEIQSLQMLVQETVEASSSICSDEVRQLQTRCLELEQQLNLLNKQANQDAPLAPAALMQTVTRSIARKLGADTEPEESVKKAQEDAELLRSLVEPLEEEIQALKEKLRETDNQLQANKKAMKVGDSKDSEWRCDMCANYEKQLVAEQTESSAAHRRARDAERSLKLATEELDATRSVHDETVRGWRSERVACAETLKELRYRVERAETATMEAEQCVASANKRTLDTVTKLTVKRRTLQEKLDTLEKDNERLVGKYLKIARELQNEDINLPDNIEELQEYALRLREDLIIASLSREAALQGEEALRGQLVEQSEEYHQQTSRYAALHNQYEQLRQHMDLLETERDQMQELGDKLRSSNSRIEELQEEKKRLQQEIMELRSRVSSLQQELDNSERVQQDFVRLSQSLQVQLERIREEDTQVRWQHEEDVTECPACRQNLPNNKRKVHCRHCGRIFCPACVIHTVASGPRGAPAKVCSVCRTLLERHTAPYFSTEAPQTPD